MSTPEMREIERMRDVIERFRKGKTLEATETGASGASDSFECLGLVLHRDDVDMDKVRAPILRKNGATGCVALVAFDASLCGKHPFMEELLRVANDASLARPEWPAVVFFFRNVENHEAWRAVWQVEKDISSTLKVSRAIARILRSYNQRIVRTALKFTPVAPVSEVGASKAINIKTFVASLRHMRERCSDRKHYSSALKILTAYVKNIVLNTSNEKYRSIRMSNKVFQKRLASREGGVACMRAIGFRQMEREGEPHLHIKIDASGEGAESSDPGTVGISFLRRILKVLEKASEVSSGNGT